MADNREERRHVDWRPIAATAALLLAMTFVLLIVAVFVQPYKDLLDTLNGTASRTACIADARNAMDVATADVLIAVLDKDETRVPELRAEIVNARDRIANLNQTCPK